MAETLGAPKPAGATPLRPNRTCRLSGGIQPRASSEGAERRPTMNGLSPCLSSPASASQGLSPVGSQRARGALDMSSLEVSRRVWGIDGEGQMQRDQHIHITL